MCPPSLYSQMDHLSNCSHVSSISGENDCDQDCLSPSLKDLDVGKFDLTSHTHLPAVSVQSNKCHGSSTPLTWRGLPRGLVGSQLQAPAQMKWSSAGSGTEARHAQSLMKIDEDCPSCSNSGPSSGRQAPEESESLPEICRPKPGANGGALFEKCDESQELPGAGMRGCAFSKPARGQSDVNAPLPVLKSAQQSSNDVITSCALCFEMETWENLWGKML